MQVDLGPRTTVDLIEGIAHAAEKRDPLAGAKAAADQRAVIHNRIILDQMTQSYEHTPADRRPSPAEWEARKSDIPTNSRFFRRLAGLRGDDAKPEKDKP